MVQLLSVEAHVHALQKNQVSADASVRIIYVEILSDFSRSAGKQALGCVARGMIISKSSEYL